MGTAPRCQCAKWSSNQWAIFPAVTQALLAHFPGRPGTGHPPQGPQSAQHTKYSQIGQDTWTRQQQASQLESSFILQVSIHLARREDQLRQTTGSGLGGTQDRQIAGVPPVYSKRASWQARSSRRMMPMHGRKHYTNSRPGIASDARRASLPLTC